MKTVVALYANGTKAYDVAQALMKQGFSKDEINVLAHSAEGELTDLVDDPTVEDIATSETPGSDVDASQGAGVGALTGGVVGLLAGLGALAIPGIGPLVAAGPIVATLIGAGIGAVTGGVAGALIDLGVPEEHATYYAESLRRGDALVAVHADDARADLAADILFSHAPLDMGERLGEWHDEGIEAEQDIFTGTVSDVLVTDEATVNSANVPDLDADSRAYMTNLDSDSSGSVEPAPDTLASALPDEERHPARTPDPLVDRAATRDGSVRVYGVDPD